MDADLIRVEESLPRQKFQCPPPSLLLQSKNLQEEGPHFNLRRYDNFLFQLAVMYISWKT